MPILQRNSLINWTVFAMLIAVEYLLFRDYILREIVPFYPHLYDQTWYLTQSYRLYENIIGRGFIGSAILQQGHMAQTLLFPTQAALIYLLFGASRSTALAINFGYFFLVQLFSCLCFKKITGRYIYGFIFIGLLLSTQALTYANDFRLDFISFCLYGLFCCAVLRSGIFLSKKWTLICLALGAYLIMMRYITGCYLLGVSVTTLAYYLGRKLFAAKPLAETSIRIKHLCWFNAGLLVVCGILFCVNFQVLHDYYIVGHATGPEKLLRLKEAMFATGLSWPILYYPVIFLKYHFPASVFLNTLFLIGLLIAAYLIAKAKTGRPKLKTRSYHDIFVFLAISILVPLGILSTDVSKSPLVIGIITIPVIYLFVFCFITLTEKLATRTQGSANYLLIAIIAFYFIQLPHHLVKILSHEHGHPLYNQAPLFEDRDTTITKYVETIGDYANALRWTTISIAAEKNADFISAPIAAFYYETHHVLFNLSSQPLGSTIFAITYQQALNSVTHADIFIADLTHYKPNVIYPFENSIAPYRQQLMQLAAKNMIKLGDFYIDGNMLRVYARPDVYLNSDNSQIALDKGVWITVPSIVARQAKAFTLEGDIHLDGTSAAPLKMVAEGPSNKLHATFITTGNHYKIVVELPAWHFDSAVNIYLSFSGAGGYMMKPTKKTFTLWGE